MTHAPPTGTYSTSAAVGACLYLVKFLMYLYIRSIHIYTCMCSCTGHHAVYLHVHVHAHCTCTCTLVYIRMCISSIIWCIFMYTYVWWEGVECTFQALCSLATGVPVHVYMVEVYRSNSLLFHLFQSFSSLPPSLPQSTVMVMPDGFVL